MSSGHHDQRYLMRDAKGGLRSPRVAVVIEKCDAARGGAAVYTHDLLVWLAARGFELHVVCRDVGEKDRLLPVHFHEVGVMRGGRSFADAAVRRLAALTVDISHDMGSTFGCDIVQSHVGSPVACQLAMDAATPWWCRHVRRLVQAFPRRHEIRRLAAQQFGSTESIFIAISGRVADDLQQIHCVPPERIRVIRNGADVEQFDASRHAATGNAVRRRYGITADELLVIAVANNYRLKGIHVLTNAVRRLRDEGLPLRLLVCGSSQTSPGAAKAAQEGIIHAGRINNIAPFYAAADVSVQASFYDACSLVTLESLASGLPVITTRANGASELIVHGINGIVLDEPGDVRALAAALRMLARNRILRASMGRSARCLMAAHGSEANFAAVLGVYAEVLEGKGRSLVREVTPSRFLYQCS